MITFGVDIDGVCRDWGGALREVWRWKTGQNLSAEDCHSFDLAKVFIHPTIDVNEIAFRSGVDYICGQAQEIIGARWALERLREDGVRLVAVTAHSEPYARRKTLDWIIEHGFPFDGIEFTGGGVPKSIVTCDINVDDSPAVIEELQAMGRQVLIWDAPYNRHLAGPRVSGWMEILTIMRGLYSLDRDSVVV
jgi:5'(3')-deoxyribonucleotidase